MSKIYKGYELMKAIADGEIKSGTRFKDRSHTFIWTGSRITVEIEGKDSQCNLFEFNNNSGTYYSLSYFLDLKFELLKDEIDIQSIEELAEDRYIVTDVLKKINELVQAIKQLDNKINK